MSSVWQGRLRGTRVIVHYDDFDEEEFQAFEDALYDYQLATMAVAAVEVNVNNESQDDVVMGVTIDGSPPVPSPIDDDEQCCLCYDDISHGQVCFKTACGHHYCGVCARDPRLNKCGRCNQDISRVVCITATKVKVEEGS
jgi:hypothetical protein